MSWWRKALTWSNPYAWQANWIYNQWAKAKSTKTGGPAFAAQYGRAVPVIYGRPKLGGAIVVYRNSSLAVPVRVLLGEAGCTDLNAYWDGARRTSGSGTLTVRDGTQTSGTATSDAARNLAYKRSSIVEVPWYGNVVLSQASFEPLGKFDSTGNIYGDADPAQVVVDMLTNTTYGLGWSASRVTVDEWGDSATLSVRQNASYDTWVNGGPLALTLSRACTERKPTRDYLEEFLDATHATVTWQFDTSSVATLYFVPRGDTSGGLFVPFQPVRYALTADDLIPNDEGELVEVMDDEGDSRSDQDNTLSIGFVERYPTDPLGFQVPTTVEVEDPVSVSRYGLKRGATLDLPCITQRGPATALGKEILKHSLYRGRPQMRIRLGWRFARLDPLDYVSITDASMGLSAYKVQVAAIDEDEDGKLTIDAVPAPLTLGNSVEHDTQSSDGNHEPENPWQPTRASATLLSSYNGVVTEGTLAGVSSVTLVAGTPDVYRIAFSANFPSTTYEVRLEKIGRTTSGATGFAPFAVVPVVQAIETDHVDVALAYVSDGTYVNLESPGIPGGTYLVLSFAAYA